MTRLSIHPDGHVAVPSDAVDEPLVWQYGRSRVGRDGLEMRVKVMTASIQDGLLKHFGQKWLDKYVADAKAEIDRWALGADGPVH